VVKQLLVLGTGTLAVEIADLAADAGFEVAGFVENLERERCEQPLEGLPVRWVDDVPALSTDHVGVCGLATSRRSGYVRQVSELGLDFATVVHPTARVSSRSTIGAGTVVSAGVVVGAYTTIGCHVLLNRGVLVGHHTTIGDFATLQPGANVAGLCSLGERSFIGMGAVVVDRKSVGVGAIVGAGAAVVEDVPANVQVLGVPARIVKQGVEPR
jgi:acetyltransferase EpsM